MPVPDVPVVDCHCHLLDPGHFGYRPGVWYEPGPAEQSDADYLAALFDAHGIRHAVVVGPNSGYDIDNSCLLDVLDRGAGRYRGMAVVDNDLGEGDLIALRDRGVVATTMQMQLLGPDAFRSAGPLLDSLAGLGMMVDVQVEHDQLVDAAPMLNASEVRVVIDHCGRPDPAAGLDQSGFRLLLDLAETGRYWVKLSGMVKASRERYPFRDAWPYVRDLLAAFGPQRCLWGSDWPFLRAPQRLDIGTLLQLFSELVPDPQDRRTILWDTPVELFGFTDNG